MLNYYKKQSKVEQGFRFLKYGNFRASEVYLKKPERIEALTMVMVLAQMVYSVAEWKLRQKLKETGDSIPDQVKKQTCLLFHPAVKESFYHFCCYNI